MISTSFWTDIIELEFARSLISSPGRKLRNLNLIYMSGFLSWIPNLTRRHLNDYQRAKLALWAKPILQEIAKRNMSLGGQGLEISTTLNVRQEIATRAKVSDNTISKAELIIKYKDSISKEAHEISCKDKSSKPPQTSMLDQLRHQLQLQTLVIDYCVPMLRWTISI